MARYRIEPPVVLQSTCELHQQVALQASDELRHLQEENGLLQQQVGRQEADVNKLRSQLHGYREERDRLRRQVKIFHDVTHFEVEVVGSTERYSNSFEDLTDARMYYP